MIWKLFSLFIIISNDNSSFQFFSFRKTNILHLLPESSNINFCFFCNEMAKIIFQQLDKKSVRRHVFFGK